MEQYLVVYLGKMCYGIPFIGEPTKSPLPKITAMEGNRNYTTSWRRGGTDEKVNFHYQFHLKCKDNVLTKHTHTSAVQYLLVFPQFENKSIRLNGWLIWLLFDRWVAIYLSFANQCSITSLTWMKCNVKINRMSPNTTQMIFCDI